MNILPLEWIPPAYVLTLLLFAHGFAAEPPVPPSGRPDRMWSQSNYNPNLTDPFCKSNAWSYPDYDLEGNLPGCRPGNRRMLKQPADCSCNSFGNEHYVDSCEAGLPDVNRIDLCLHAENTANSSTSGEPCAGVLRKFSVLPAAS
jgi:hypothetical protein